MSKKQDRLDKIMAASRERMQEEVSALLGKTLSFAEPETRILSKEDFFSEPAGKSVLAHVQFDGELEGRGCLIVPIRDAIRIGGTLIMLPDSELETVVSEEEYTEELEDSYGEIANIICGSLTSVFEEQYPKSFRLVRTEQEVILPVKVDVESDEPVPNGTYYLMTSSMALEGTEMGKLQLLLPTAVFGLVEEPAPAPDAAEEVTVESPMQGSADEAVEETQSPGVIERQPAEPAESVGTIAPDTPDPGEEAPPVAVGKTRSPADLKKQQERIDALLTSCLEKVGEEVGALLGGTLAITPEKNQPLSKEDLLEQAGGKQVLARMDVRGDAEGEAYLMVSLRDAVFLGGTLIMLPEAELEEVVREEDFGEDAQDAYGEIANIIAGVYTLVFEEQYRKKLGFVKTGLETIIPVKIDPESDEVIPDTVYYLSSGSLSYNDKELGRIQAVFPAVLFELEELLAPEEASADQARAAASDSVVSGGQEDPAGTTVRPAAVEDGDGAAAPTVSSAQGAADILIFTDDDKTASSLASILGDFGYSARILHYRDPVANYLTPAVSLVFLVMEEVSEQGFGMAIKLSSAGLQVPLVAAAPAWTRTAVLKAVKYGAVDILVTPATSADIQEKLETNMVKKAA